MKVARLLPSKLRPLVRAPLVAFRHRGLRGADAMLISYPKSGSTWLRFLIAHAVTGDEVDFDSIRRVFPPVGAHRHGPACLPGGGRLVRSHEPFSRFRGRTDMPIVYLGRDGRDVAVSYFHHTRRVEGFEGDFAAFIDPFVAGDIDSYGPWVDHVVGAHDMLHVGSNRLLLLTYEDLRRDTAAQLARVLAFLGAPRSHDVVAEVVVANDKDRMRAKEPESALLRAQARGNGGDFVGAEQRAGWRELLDEAGRERLERALGPGLAALGYARETTAASSE